MTPKFWKNAWQKSQTNFTQKKLNPMLINFLKAINTPKNSRAFMLLCFYAFMLLCFYAFMRIVMALSIRIFQTTLFMCTFFN